MTIGLFAYRPDTGSGMGMLVYVCVCGGGGGGGDLSSGGREEFVYIGERGLYGVGRRDVCEEGGIYVYGGTCIKARVCEL